MITLLDGRSVAVSDITFDTGSYHFYYGGEDITNLITRADKVANWSNFDVTVDNNRIFNESASGQGANAVTDIQAGINASAGNSVGTTSTLGNLTTQLTTDPLAAPLASADNILSNTFKSWFSSYTGWLILGIIGLLIYFRFIRK